ncbi:MAG: cytochrome C biogenesis protein [Peptostreptococcaceae bacterium]|nr:cytochrome C biogenesis protein [Peptostreptococcaceae bacterium]
MKQVKLEIFTPESCLETLLSKLSEMGACRVGRYSYVSSYAKIIGTWMPEEGSDPYEGKIGEISRAEEYKLEVRCPYDRVQEAIDIVRSHHPYEEPVIHIIPLLNHEFVEG